MSKKENESVTRGFGFLESYLAKKRSKKANSLIPTFSRRGRILDIGCGTYPYFLAETEFDEKYGIDKSDACTRHADLPGPHKTLRLQPWDFGKENKLPFENEFFDVVTMLAVFEHIETDHIRRLVSEIRRILKKGGIYILTTPAGWTDRLLRFLAAIKLVSAVEIEDHKDTYSHKKIKGILVDGGFPNENIQLGHFELFMNIWGTACPHAGGPYL
ncbi:MAG: class I SAM-dependent methyltransferase [bacterium]|nr:class I SAM-dependent methyltransferase [bacterium]